MTLNSYEQEQARKKAYYEFAQEQVKLSNLRRAVAYYVSRKNRTEHPDGKLKGRPGKWYPHPKEEHRSCCDYIKPPSHACPYSLMNHCRSAKHIGNLLEVDPKEIKRLARIEINKEEERR